MLTIILRTVHDLQICGIWYLAVISTLTEPNSEKRISALFPCILRLSRNSCPTGRLSNRRNTERKLHKNQVVELLCLCSEGENGEGLFSQAVVDQPDYFQIRAQRWYSLHNVFYTHMSINLHHNHTSKLIRVIYDAFSSCTCPWSICSSWFFSDVVAVLFCIKSMSQSYLLLMTNGWRNDAQPAFKQSILPCDRKTQIILSWKNIVRNILNHLKIVWLQILIP